MDIKLVEGDFSLIEGPDGLDIEVYDEPEDLLLRAVSMPLGAVALLSPTELLDGELGNDLFQELSEPLTPNWISRARTHVLNAIDEMQIDRLQIEDIRLSVVDLNQIAIQVIYADGTLNTTLTL